MNKEELDKIYNEDCLVGMKRIPDHSIDAIICDLPYGTTSSKWDICIPLKELWEQYARIIKSNGVICLFGSEPFTTYLNMSNIDNFKYSWIWVKTTCTGFQHARNMPLKNYETISVFSYGSMGHKSLLGDKRMKYNPQGIIRIDKISRSSKNKWGNIVGKRKSHKEYTVAEFKNYPKMVLNFKKDKKNLHPNQKPVSLIEYLIRTYTDECEIVLDNCMGSGTTAIACLNTKRHYIGFEKEKKYYDIAQERIKNHIIIPSLFGTI